MNTLRICILGGTGFVGRRIASKLAAQGHQLTIVTRRRSRHRSLLVLPGMQLIEGDVFNSVFLQRVFAGEMAQNVWSRLRAVPAPADRQPMDAVIHLIGILNESGHSGKGFARVHAELPAAVAQACIAAGVPRLLHMSALNASAKAPSHYLRSKAAGEEAVHRAGGESLHVTSFRPSVIFGANDSFINRFAALLRITPGLFPLACPQARFQPVFVDDVADAFIGTLGESAAFGRRYDLCGPKVYRLDEIVHYIAAQLGRRVSIVGLPDALSHLQAMVLEFVPGKPFSLDNYRSLQLDSVCRGEAGRALREVFGVTPKSLEEIVPTYLGGSARAA